MKQIIPFSIVIPVYRVEKYLPQAIESVLAQSVSDWELILVDDGSPDGCGEICDRYAAMDTRIRVIHKENGGLVSARQAGIKQCNGSYVLNLDGDDYWDSDLLLNLQTIIEQHHPDGLFFGFRKVTQDGEPICELNHKVEDGLYTGEALRRIQRSILYDPENPDLNRNTGCTSYGIVLTAFRRELLSPIQLLVPKEIKVGEDAAVTIPAICQCQSVYFLNKVAYNYRIRHSSISHTFSATEMEETAKLIEHLKKYASIIPSQNFEGFTYREMELYWIKMARNLSSYQAFKHGIMESFQSISGDPLKGVSQCRLKLKYRLRIFVAKHNLWYLFWLVYHRD